MPEHVQQNTFSGCKNMELEKLVQLYLDQHCEQSLQAVMEEGAALVHHFARLFSRKDRKGAEREDLAQAGFEGLMKALKRFDPQRGVRFSTYASHCIMGEIRREIWREKTFDRPGWIVDLQGKILQETERILKESGHPPTLQEIAQAVNVEEAGVVQAMQAGSVPLDELDISRIRSIRYESFQLPIEDKILVRQALSRLSELQQKAIYMLFYQDMTQQQVAEKLGLSQRKVSRLKYLGLEQMNKYLS